MNEHEAVEALERLGLTGYEAKMFIALHQLRSGSARDVAEVADIPRPQVYSTADSLEEQGLIQIRQSDPIQYRPVALEEAETILRNRFEHTQETAFEYIERVRTEDDEDQEREGVWTITGRETIDARVDHLVSGAEEEVLFGTRSASQVREDTVAALRQAAADGVSVTVISRDPTMDERFETAEGITVVDPSIEQHEEETGRLLVVDGDTVLLSVACDTSPDDSVETAIWSEETEFSRVLVRLIRGYLQA